MYFRRNSVSRYGGRIRYHDHYDHHDLNEHDHNNIVNNTSTVRG
jgi:hypothetical protein